MINFRLRIKLKQFKTFKPKKFKEIENKSKKKIRVEMKNIYDHFQLNDKSATN